MFPMGLLASGERGLVVENGAGAAGSGAATEGHARPHSSGPCCGGCGGKGRAGAAGRVEEMGIRPGKVVEMLSNEGRGALLVKVDESRIAVGRGVAMKIMVRRTDDESRLS
jgi:ferrous iron transport protein A